MGAGRGGDPTGILSAGFDCLNLGGAVCSNNNTGGRTDSLLGWMASGYFGSTFDASGSPAADDAVHYPQDGVNYHELSIWTDAPDTPGGSFEFPFRCDAAPYVNGGGVDDVAAHIKKAQDDPAHTFPGGVGIEIPGKPGSKPLTRLYPKMDAESSLAYSNCCKRRLMASETEKIPPGPGRVQVQVQENWSGTGAGTGNHHAADDP